MARGDLWGPCRSLAYLRRLIVAGVNIGWNVLGHLRSGKRTCHDRVELSAASAKKSTCKVEQA